MSESPPPKPADEGAPAWVMTFADLMSLLMCFFVLLLSFSETDLQKYKQVAGSMEKAFGVQREVEAHETPKGTSVIAQEFSSGRPAPTVVNEVRQATVDDSKQTLEFTDAMDDGQAHSESEGGEGDGGGDGPNQQTEADAAKLLESLADEVAAGIISVETTGSNIKIRIREKGSFPSGLAVLHDEFSPVLQKLKAALVDVEGQVIVAGHTDNIPIKTARFRSNWELSAARAVTVVHELLTDERLKIERFVVEGHGEAHPLLPNETAEDRATNRRVELTIIQGPGGAGDADKANAEIGKILRGEDALPESENVQAASPDAA